MKKSQITIAGMMAMSAMILVSAGATRADAGIQKWAGDGLVGGRELLADDALDALAGRLDHPRFLRVHRSALINIEFLPELERDGDRKYTAVLSDPLKTRVAVSRERLAELKIRLGVE